MDRKWRNVLICAAVVLLFQFQGIDGAETRESEEGSSEDRIFDNVFKVDMPTSTSLIKDSDGFIWLPTQNGLVRFDGYETMVFKTGDNSISNDYTTSIIEDSNGHLWIGSQGGGLDRYNKNTNQFTNFRHNPEITESIGSNTVSINPQSIMEDRYGNIWVATQESGISVLNPTTEHFEHITHDENKMNTISSNQMWSFLEDDEGYIWAGAVNGLNRIDPETKEVLRFVHDPEDGEGIGPGWVYRIIQDSQNSDILWLGLVGSGLHKFDKKTLTFERFLYPEGEGADQIITMTEGNDNDLWIGWFDSPAAGGMVIFNKATERFTSYTSRPGDGTALATDTVYAITKDDQGILWIANSSGLVQKYDMAARNFKHYYNIPFDESSLQDNVTISYYEDSQGVMWFGGTQEGLIRYDEATDSFRTYSVGDGTGNGLLSNFISRIFEDSDGTFYAAGRGGHLQVFDREHEQVIRTYVFDPEDASTLAANDSVRYIIEDQDDSNILYMGSFIGGFHVLDKEQGTFTNYLPEINNSDALQNNTIVHLHQNPYNGDVWLSSNGGGIILFSRTDQTFKPFLNDPDDITSIGSNNIWEIQQYDEKYLWIATVGGGLNRMNLEDGSFKRHDMSSGFPANTILSIRRDKNGILWMGTDEGLVSFDPQSEATKVYTQMDGLQGDVFLDAAAWYASDGTMWFGGVNGINRFDPTALIENKTPPEMVLTSLTQGGIPIETDQALSRLETLDLPLNQNFFEFSYSALNYTRTAKNQYAYMLEGFDKDWYYSGDKRFGRYSGLPAGDYILRIKGSNNDGYWNEEGVSIAITVVPPFYKTLVFYIICVLMGVLLMILAYFLRMRNVKKQQRELEHLVTVRTEELEKKSEEETAMNEELMSLNEELTALNTELHDSNGKLIEMQDMLIQTEKMTAMGNLVAGLAHEINTPIGVGVTASSSLSELVKDYTSRMGSDGMAPAEQTEYLQDISDTSLIIQKNIERAGKLIRNFKLVSTDQSNARIRTITAKDYLDEIIMTLHPLVHRNGIEIKLECDPYLELRCDPGNLSQIVTNLVQNAVIHGFEADQTGTVIIALTMKDDAFWMSLKDDGQGMTSTVAGRIFDPFYTTKRGQGGTGLGLYIVYNIVTQQMAGTIRCCSSIGEGTEFVIQWPKLQEKHYE